jgi:hypothetical protein
MSNDRLSDDVRLALRAFDLFCSAGRPQRPTGAVPGPELVEVSGIALFEAFARQHPGFADQKADILNRLPVLVRVHSEWWLSVRGF